MKLHVSQQAFDWFSKEFQFSDQKSIRLFPRYGGLGEKYNGYSVGISIENPIDCGMKFEIGNKTFYVEQVDLWFFNDCSLTLEITNDELVMVFTDSDVVSA
ncbi:HesB/YadR/YfhF family protein [Anaerobacillus sp. MEB173]|uniref:HesB/YadR/YfhF family protein n=1 Tax=Anaerobacillus sp. MEB173 TaxID=3383345 RepID=UPI003F8EA906